MRLLTWNTQWCCGLDGEVRPLRIVSVARELADFDVLCLQEIAVNYPGLRGNAGHDQPELFADLLHGYDVVFGPAVDEWDPQGGRSQFGNLIATRLPILQVRHHALPYPADPGVESMPRLCTSVTVRDPVLGPVRVMTTHLEYYSRRQRLAQAQALRELHQEACAHAAGPPKALHDGSAFGPKPHTAQAVLCGDFNLGPDTPEYDEITKAGEHGRWWDSWRLLHADVPHPPSFALFDRTYEPKPLSFDFVFVSDALKDKVRSIAVDGTTQASDHQPVAVEIA